MDPGEGAVSHKVGGLMRFLARRRSPPGPKYGHPRLDFGGTGLNPRFICTNMSLAELMGAKKTAGAGCKGWVSTSFLFLGDLIVAEGEGEGGENSRESTRSCSCGKDVQLLQAR